MRTVRPVVLCLMLFTISRSGFASSRSSATVQPLTILSDGQSGLDGFGTTVAMSADGRTVVVGAPGSSGGPVGAAYIFVQPEGGWTQGQPYTAMFSDGTNSDDLFGSSVAISSDGNTVVIGSPYAIVNGSMQGAAFVFEKPVGGWSTTSHYTAKLASSRPTYQGFLGSYVAIDGGTIVAGVPQGPFGPGVAFVFVKPSSGWKNMTQTAALTPSDNTNGDDFGPVAISGDTIVVGAFQNDTSGHLPGAAYVYVEPASGWINMNETAQLTASDGVRFDNLGISVAIQASTIVAGAYENNVGNGAAYVYLKPASGWMSMTETAELTPKNGFLSDWFGYAVTLSGRYAVVGAPNASESYIYAEPKTGWHSTSNAALDLIPPSGYQSFGRALAAGQASLVVGSGGSNTIAPDAVLVYGK